MAISVLATASSSAIGTLVTEAQADIAQAKAAMVASAPGQCAAAGVGDTSEQTPSDDDCTDPMTPPGDDVPPEVEIDLENEPWDLCSTLEVPPVTGVTITFTTSDDSHEAHVPEATSPPPRA